MDYVCEDIKEELPPNAPKQIESSMTLRVYVDSYHSGCQLTRFSMTDFVVLLNKVPIYWQSNNHTSFLTSTFGSEFVAMKQGADYVRGLH